MRIKTLLAAVMSVLVCLALVSCRKTITKDGEDGKTDMVTDTPTIPALDIAEGTGDTGGEGDIRGEFVSQPTILTVNFDFDRYALSDAARQTLQKNAAIIKTHRDWMVMVEGHCDPRGTVEYNLALGQKRAKEVRDYYIRLGVSDSMLGTISYGEEKLLCEEETEDCWLRNRRAETKVRVK